LTQGTTANRSCLGYNTTSSDGLTVNVPESEIVRWIFGRFLAGDSLGKIAVGLRKRNIDHTKSQHI